MGAMDRNVLCRMNGRDDEVSALGSCCIYAECTPTVNLE